MLNFVLCAELNQGLILWDTGTDNPMARRVAKEQTTSQWIGLKMIGSNWLPSSLDVIHECVVVNEGFQSKK